MKTPNTPHVTDGPETPNGGSLHPACYAASSIDGFYSKISNLSVASQIIRLLEYGRRMDDALLLCKTGRHHEQEQHCALTTVISEVCQELKTQTGPDACLNAYKKLNAVTMELWLQPAENCAARMPHNE